MILDVHPILEELNLARQRSGASAATMSFVVYFDDKSIADWIKERAHAVAEKHPSRVILLDGTQCAGNEHIDTAMPRGEWVEIGAAGSDGETLAAALSALALPEAPVVLAWIASGISRDDRFAVLAQRANTVICSSSVTDSGTSSLGDLMMFTQAHPEIDIADLAYVRLSAWQNVIAEFFDDERLMEELFRLRTVEITAGSQAEAYYLLGWLASRLQWSPCGERAMCNREKETIVFSITVKGTPRRLMRVSLASETTTFTAEVFDEDPDVVCLQTTGANAQDRRCEPLRGIDIASLVERAILQKRDPVFRETLTMTKDIVDAQKTARS
jgi:glucose-6-phosphate dehydrogenase assembly protein OpcA